MAYGIAQVVLFTDTWITLYIGLDVMYIPNGGSGVVVVVTVGKKGICLLRLPREGRDIVASIDRHPSLVKT